MFIRFVVGTDAENAAWLSGLFCHANALSEGGELEPYHARYLDQVIGWFNENLRCPPFERNLRSGKWTRHAVAWFRPEAREPIRRMWDIAAILFDHGLLIRLITSEKPGTIVYEDPHQIVAETPRWA